MTELIDMIKTAYLPEFVIIVFILINILASVFANPQFYKLSKWVTLFGICLAIASTFNLQIEPEAYAFDGAFLTNIYTVFFKILILICAFSLHFYQEI